jgi:hypothetical protein
LRSNTEPSFGGGVEAEVADVRVTAGDDHDPRVRIIRQVQRHQAGGAAVEREWTLEHPRHAQRYEVLHPVGVLFDEVRDGVAFRRA